VQSQSGLYSAAHHVASKAAFQLVFSECASTVWVMQVCMPVVEMHLEMRSWEWGVGNGGVGSAAPNEPAPFCGIQIGMMPRYALL
jgi:hypothetical protein